jgi:hypothetical protein
MTSAYCKKPSKRNCYVSNNIKERIKGRVFGDKVHYRWDILWQSTLQVRYFVTKYIRGEIFCNKYITGEIFCDKVH